eukprot:TRINITY_DN44478_c0_g1_i1.p1 TRINITY_DN44478_c0_g1~~TRINITY_DN44478_c0_g1_i1.p1  ORF type:complete len:295 (-),score=72.36 TRINITY_DN44478_c0_g1_i1:34-918(-)
MCFCFPTCLAFLFFHGEVGLRDLVRSRGLGDVYKRQLPQLRREHPMHALPTVPATFQTVDEYAAVWRPLILEEAAAAIRAGLEQSIEQLELNLQSFSEGSDMGCYVGLQEPTQLVFGSPGRESSEMEAGSVLLMCGGGMREVLGYCTHKTGTSVVVHALIPVAQLEVRSRWRCSLLASCTNHERMYSATANIASAPAVLIPYMLGGAGRAQYSALEDASTPTLNSEQCRAVQDSTANAPGVVLIQGPPGTGKTHTVMSIISTAVLHQARRCLLCTSDAADEEDSGIVRGVRTRT